MSVFEMLMIGLFGISWPVSIYKTWKTKQSSGRSLFFLFAVQMGYVAGIIHKVLYSRDFVLAMYCFNFINVSLDLALCLYYAKHPGGRKRT